MILACQKIEKAFGGKSVLNNVNFLINEGEKAAVIGINGAGKTTLFKIITGEYEADHGEVMMKGAGMEPYIKDFLCFGQTQTSKDLTILKLMEKNNLTSPVYVGDTQGDADSCKKAGIPFIFAAYGLGDVKEDYPTIHSFSELKNILRELD